MILEKLWPPIFLEKLSDFEGIEDSQALFRCTVNSKPAPVITWLVIKLRAVISKWKIILKILIIIYILNNKNIMLLSR